MVKYINECRDCAVPGYPCMNEYCPNKRVRHVFCYVCGTDMEDWYNYNDMQICEECIMEKLEKDRIIKRENVCDFY